jgi:hypothetical protein
MACTSIGYAQQCAELPACKQVHPELADVNSQVLQDVLKRVDRAFEGFFQRVKDGQRPGYPRFFRKEERALSRAHRKLSRAQQGRSQRDKRRKVMARVHARERLAGGRTSSGVPCGLAHQTLRVDRGGSPGGAQPGQEPAPGQEYRRCGVVVIFRKLARVADFASRSLFQCGCMSVQAVA